jgi:hypothetical protein
MQSSIEGAEYSNFLSQSAASDAQAVIHADDQQVEKIREKLPVVLGELPLPPHQIGARRGHPEPGGCEDDAGTHHERLVRRQGCGEYQTCQHEEQRRGDARKSKPTGAVRTEEAGSHHLKAQPAPGISTSHRTDRRRNSGQRVRARRRAAARTVRLRATVVCRRRSIPAAAFQGVINAKAPRWRERTPQRSTAPAIIRPFAAPLGRDDLLNRKNLRLRDYYFDAFKFGNRPSAKTPVAVARRCSIDKAKFRSLPRQNLCRRASGQATRVPSRARMGDRHRIDDGCARRT